MKPKVVDGQHAECGGAMVSKLPNAIWPKGAFVETVKVWQQESLQKKDTSVTFWAERNFFCHTYDTSMTIIVTKPGIIIDVVGSYFHDKKS